MRIFWLPFIIILLINIAVDYCIYRKMQQSRWLRGAPSMLHIVIAAVAHLAIIIALLQPSVRDDYSSDTLSAIMRIIWFYFMLYVPRLIWAAFYQLSRPKALPQWLSAAARGVAVLLAAVSFIAMWVGYSVTPRQFQVTQVEVSSARLPKAFDGYRICHISDMHLGTYGTDTTFITQCIDTINALQPDLIVFTGDLVSSTTDEAYIFSKQLARLKARDGVLSILGNHDYDDYTRMTPEERQADHEMLCELITDAGWKLLTNQSTILYRDNDSITVAGTENYSRGHTPNYCRLNSALTNTNDSTFTILLQHNPQLWREQVVGKTGVDLMLSGHTHALQIMIPFFGHTLSPARFVYREWGGLYSENGQHLYVNIGLGMVGVPARIGATPEITMITLKR